MNDVKFVYDTALLHYDPNRYRETARTEPEGVSQTDAQESDSQSADELLLDTAKEKLRETYGGTLTLSSHADVWL